MQEENIKFNDPTPTTHITVDDVKEVFGSPSEPEIRTSLRRRMSTNTLTIDKGHNKNKKVVKGLKLAHQALDANMHKTLTKQGVPRKLDGNKLGLRKRFVVAQEQFPAQMNRF